MAIIELIFWISLIILFYCYAGYGLLLYAYSAIKSVIRKTPTFPNTDWPAVTLIIAAWNEADVLKEKIINTLNLEYATGKLQVICITDGSEDDSVSIVQEYPQIHLLHIPMRQGKVAAVNRAMQEVKTPIVFFTDANAILSKQALIKMADHFKDPRIGGVAGEKKILAGQSSSVGKAEGLYWRYESFLKKQDAAFHSVVGAAGELFAIRTELWQPLDENIILDDFVITMQVRLSGSRFSYEPGAWSTEAPSVSFAEERKRKVRIAAGAFQALHYLEDAMNIIKYPALSFQFFSRRILRWFVAPVLLPVLFITNLIMVFNDPELFCVIALVGQLFFYLAALTGYLLVKVNKQPGWFNAPLYFVFMNSCLISGSLLFFKKEHSVLWDKSLRESFE